MLERTERLEALERRWERRAYDDLTFPEALIRFGALWAEARALQKDRGGEWRSDLEPDLAIARAVNGLPPS
ncbi:MAG: hypothetical protein ACE5HP_04860 [Gemmatimonadota bacterium]